MASIIIFLLFTNIKFKLCIITVISLLLFLICLMIKHIRTRESNLYKFRIKYFTLTYLLVISYILIYLCLLLYVRYTYFFKELDLKPIMYLIYKICFTHGIFNNILIITIILLFFIIGIKIIKIIHSFFIKQIIKLQLYIFYGKEPLLNKFSFIINNFLLINLIHKLDALITKLDLTFISKTFDNFIYKFLLYLIRFIINLLPFVILITIFIYDMLTNNQILSITFNRYLLFFVLFSIYQRLNNYLKNTNTFINCMLFNMYYRDYTVKYINIKTFYELKILQYVNNDLQQNTEDLNNVFNSFFEIYVESCVLFTTNNGRDYYNNNYEVSTFDNNTSKDIVNYEFK